MLTNNRNHLNNTNEKNTKIQLGVVDGIPKNKSKDTS